MFCPNCGLSAQPGLARCGHCNFKLPETALPQAAPGSETVLCWNCAHPNAAQAVQCGHCNAKLDKQAKRFVAAPRRLPVTPNTLSHDE